MRRTTTLASAAGLALGLCLVPTSAKADPQPVHDAVTCDGKVATIVAPSAAGTASPWVVGTPGDDVIVGTDGPDRIDGAGGNDTICSLDHSDQIIGGPGNDRLFGGDDEYLTDEDYWGDMIQPGPGDDYVDLGASLGPKNIFWMDSIYADKVSYADAPGPVVVDLDALTAIGHGHDTFAPTPTAKYTGVVGSPYDDVLRGGPAHDQIHGGAGDDIITGGPGEDLLDGDLATGLDQNGGSEPGSDVVRGGPDDDAISGGHGTDTLLGGGGEDWIVGQDGSERSTLNAGPGDDRLQAVAGTRARGGSGDDQFYLDLPLTKDKEPARVISGGRGTDRLEFANNRTTNPGPYDLTVNVPKRFIKHHGHRLARIVGTERFVLGGNSARGFATFRGGRRAELFRVEASGFPVRLYGGGGADVLVGGDKDDLLHGGPGRDRLVAGWGRDRCLRGERLESCERRR